MTAPDRSAARCSCFEAGRDPSCPIHGIFAGDPSGGNKTVAAPRYAEAHLVVPAIYLTNTSGTTAELRRFLRATYQRPALHIEYRWPTLSDFESVRRALLWG